MTPKEAKEGLKLINLKSVHPFLSWEEMKQVRDTAIDSLEKQIPMKPDYEGDVYSDGELVYDIWICPNCGMHYEIEYDNYKHCPNCGQAIDWSEE